MKRGSKLLKVESVVPNAFARTCARLRVIFQTSAWDKPIHLALVMLIAVLSLLSCETANYAPPVKSTARDLPKLDRGRTLFVHRCIECHTLPAIWKYSREDWPKIVNDMSRRASLKPADREAVIAYILAVRKAL
jgi:hypothetical protein